MTTTDVERVFASVGCTGALCVEDSTGEHRVTLSADEPVVAASVIKVLVAVEVERHFADGSINPRERIQLAATPRTPGPVGFSLYDDDVEVSARDLVVSMLTISDNVATDALLDLVGIDACNRTASELGLVDTVITSPLHQMIDSIAQAAGFETWAELVAGGAPRSVQESAALDRAVNASAAMTPSTATRTTARDMCRLLRAIWSDRAAPSDGCRRIRGLMDLQLTRDRLTAAFPPPAQVAAKSGGLAGLVRNEVGTINFPDGRRYFAAVFTRRNSGAATPAEINTAIGQAAARAVEHLKGL